MQIYILLLEEIEKGNTKRHDLMFENIDEGEGFLTRRYWIDIK